MRNWTRKTVTVSFTVFSIGLVGLWIRSYARTDSASVTTQKWMRSISSNRGVIEYVRLVNISHSPNPFTSYSANSLAAKPKRLGSMGPPPSWSEEWRDSAAVRDFGPLVRIVRLPHALFAMAFAIPTVLLVFGRRCSSGQAAQACALCRYNLTGKGTRNFKGYNASLSRIEMRSLRGSDNVLLRYEVLKAHV